MKKTQLKQGFTLVELMVVMAIIAVLATMIIGAIQLARSTATETVHRSNVKAVQTALEGYFATNRTYCKTTETTKDLQCGTQYSLKKAAGILGVNLSSGGSSSGTCVANGNQEKGGRLTNLETSGYAIIPADSSCGKYTSFEDVIQSGLGTPLTALPTY